MNLDDHVAALRDLGDEAADGSSTRLRVRETLEHGHGVGRARLVAVCAVLLVASASWGFATGRIQQLWRTPDRAPATAPTPTIATNQIVVAPAPAPKPEPAPEPVVEAVPAPVAVPRVLAKPASRLYAKAHELYFHDANYAAALTAFDDYLAHEPDGQFVAEARYNRALCLIHLDQLADARLALQPFADGSVLAGYREREATTLIEKIDHRLNGTR
jgi:TolA-binding protein